MVRPRKHLTSLATVFYCRSKITQSNFNDDTIFFSSLLCFCCLEGQTHYISLMRGNLQLRVSDAVYVLRDMLEESVSGNSPPRKVTYKTVKNVDYADLDIFRIERLWIDEK